MMVATPKAAFFPIFVPLTRAIPTSSPNMPTKAQKKGSVRINIIYLLGNLLFITNE
jgi:hypothetical protein